ncbi:Rz-like lysis system protein LysB [Pantoea coffeiphila]|uniref:LysB family transcriptional regulator n=1 Tax=Pantoea coffeiphila TaxID=1465635 RepID=A0A2S9IBZ9_9GAMM|nr:Rz-like lysis system protein LysB [Pantoea coffeiphila]PRD15320.1 LysB family transcriptional regulator [Pantoea coffeiphila]
MLRLIVAVLAMTLLALAFTGWRLSEISGELTSAQRVIGTLSAGIESRDKVITRLQVQEKESGRREVELRLLQGRASGAALGRELQIQREAHAKPDLRNWSDAALPADVIRLHARPTFSNARDYLDWLSSRGQLPDAGQ